MGAPRIGLALVIVIAACGGTTTTPSPATSTTTPATSAATTASAPLPSPSGPNRAEERKVTIDGTERVYSLYVPPTVDRSRPAPLVIFLHGSGITAARTERDTELSLAAERERFVAAYPQALNGWNYGCCNAAFNQKIDDLALLRQILQRTMAETSIDPDRIYLAGVSAGATLAYRVVCEAPELFAAIGTISGGGPLVTCAPKADLSLIEIHGTKDELSPYGGCSPATIPCGNAALTLPAVEPMVARLRELFGCPAPIVERAAPVTTTKASPCRGGTEVTLMTIEGGAHLTPIATATGGTQASADVPVLLKFLLAHRRPAAR